MSRTSPDSDMPALAVRLLGAFAVRVDGGLVPEEEWRRRKVARLVQLLALADGHALHREQVEALLWPELDATAAAQNLHHTLYRARRALEPQLGRREQPRFLQLRNDLVVLASDGQLEIDLERFERAAAAACETDDPRLHREAIALCTGELLPDERYEEWVLERADRTRATLGRLLLRLAALEREGGRTAEAIELLRRAAGLEPLEEEPHAELIELLGLAGRRREAIAHYERVEALMRRELDAAPGARLMRACEAVRSGAIVPSAAVAPPPLAVAAHAGVEQLPAAVSRFVGREAEIAELVRLLGEERLVTLLGPGGVGKSRLAIAVGRTLGDVDGAWFAQLGELTDPALVTGAVVAAMKLSPPPGLPLADALASSLRDRRGLLMLDTCEHVRAGVAALAATLLERCPRLRIVATSRQPLGLVGEILWRVPPLATPPAGASFDGGEIARSEAVQLFVDRCHAVRPGFALDAANAPAVVEVCRRLEGIPLAIELAAARVRAVTVEQLASRLETRLPVLVGGSDTAARRHRTLRATIEWSHDLLSNPARVALRRLAVFSGGWTLDAAEQVVADGDLPAERMLDLLTELLDQSLIQVEAEDGAARYRMLDTVREFALERVREAGEVEALRDRHLACFLALAETMPGERFPASAVQTGWFDRLSREHGNLAAALDRALGAHRDRDRGLRLAHALRWYLLERGRFEEGQHWLAPLLREPHAIPERLFAHTTLTVALFTWRQGDYERALELTRAALRRFRTLGDPWGLALATCLAGMLQQLLGELEPGIVLTEESLDRYRALGDVYGIDWQLVILARAAVVQRDPDRAVALAEEGLTLSRREGHGVGEGWALAYLGLALEAQGDLAQARERFRGALARLSHEDIWGGDLVRVALARVTARQGDLAGALAIAGEAMARLRDSGSQELGALLHAYSVVALELDDPVRAARLLGAVERLGTHGTVMDPNLVTRDVERAREALGAKRFADELAAGREAPLEDAIAAALALAAPVSAGRR